MDTVGEQSLATAPLAPLDLGTRIGQVQVFGWLAKHSASAGAERLKEIKETRSYESLGLTWEDFCTRHVGISRSYADRLIQNLNEFGEPYFQLSAITPVSAESYRALSPAITPEGIEFEDETIPLTPENAPRIREAVQHLRTSLRHAELNAPRPDITHLQIRLDACFEQMFRLTSCQEAGTRAALRGLIEYSQEKLRRLAKSTSD
jgi:hypothetical protein